MAFADDMAALERRRQIAQALMGQGFQPQQAQQSGRFLVGPTALSTLGRVGSLALGNVVDRNIAQKETAATNDERNRLAQALLGMAGGGGASTAVPNPAAATGGPNADATTQSSGPPAGGALPPTAPAAPPGADADPRRAAAVAALRGLPLQALQQATQQQALDQFKPPEKVDLGDSWGLVKNGQVVGRIPKGASPDATMGARTTMRGQDLTAGTAANGQRIQVRGQDIAAGTAKRGQDIAASTAASGQGVTMRGQDLNYGMEDKKLGAKQATANSTVDAGLQHQSEMIANTQSALNDAIKNTSRMTTGVMGAATRGNPLTHGAGSKALTLENQIKTIQANLGFDTLNQMRQMSKSGGALGSITERELDLLGSVVANLDPNMNRADLTANLGKIQTHLNNLAQLNAAMRQQRAAGVQAPAQADEAAAGGGGIDADMAQYGGS
jgi:hypothetical protein